MRCRFVQWRILNALRRVGLRGSMTLDPRPRSCHDDPETQGAGLAGPLYLLRKIGFVPMTIRSHATISASRVPRRIRRLEQSPTPTFNSTGAARRPRISEWTWTQGDIITLQFRVRKQLPALIMAAGSLLKTGVLARHSHIQAGGRHSPRSAASADLGS